MGCFHSSSGDVRMLKVKVPCRASSGCRPPNRHAQYNSTRALTVVQWTGLRVFCRMFLYVINRVIAPYIFSEIKTVYRSSESASFLRPRGVAGTFAHLTHINHLPAPLHQSCLTVHPLVCNKDRSWLRHDVVQNRARVCVSPWYGTLAGCG